MSKLKDKQICSKCGQSFYCDDHHILPKGIFGDNTTEPLCKNCHYEFHRFLGFKYLRKKNKQPAEFYLRKYATWLISVIIGISLGLYLN